MCGHGSTYTGGLVQRQVALSVERERFSAPPPPTSLRKQLQRRGVHKTCPRVYKLAMTNPGRLVAAATFQRERSEFCDFVEYEDDPTVEWISNAPKPEEGPPVEVDAAGSCYLCGAPEQRRGSLACVKCWSNLG